MRSEREREIRVVTEKHNIGTAVCVQLECPEIFRGTNVLLYVLHYSSQFIVVFKEKFDDTYYRILILLSYCTGIVLYTDKLCTTIYLVTYYIVFGWFWLWYVLQ